MKIVHLTSVHKPEDPRIFLKQCVSAAAAGHAVVLIAPGLESYIHKGVSVLSVPPPSGRLQRMTSTAIHVFKAALNQRADIYQIHDPELLPQAMILKILGKRVIYDVHEDYVTSIKQKQYLPRILRCIIAFCFDWFERACASYLTLLIAEKYYSRRFPNATQVLNYPFLTKSSVPRDHDGSVRLIYTGSVTADRGAFEHVRLLKHLPGAELRIIGRIAPDLHVALNIFSGESSNRLKLSTPGQYVPHAEIVAAYQNNSWLCGLALFPKTQHYYEKELTKIFEYMAYGIPIVCSDFPIWRELVEENGVGICVSPEDPDAAVNSIQRLLKCPNDWLRMSQIGMELAKTKYCWDSEAKKLLSLYESVNNELADYRRYI